MKLCFISNFLNHHQTALCESFYAILKDDFKFISTEKMPEEQINLGYQKDYSVPYLVDGNDPNVVYSLLDDFDVFIVGHCPYEYKYYGFTHNKLVFFYSERIFRDGTWHQYSPLARHNMKKLYPASKTQNAYLLCASAYSTYDYNCFNSFVDRTFKWGYFPAMSECSFDELMTKKKPNSIIWVGRFLKLKQTTQLLAALKMIKQKEIPFHLTLVGSGEEEKNIKKFILDNQLSDDVTMIGSLPFKEVRSCMETHDIGVFTSNFMEGWGAVVNEYMSSACATISNYKAGATLYLCENDSGMIYDDSVEALASCLETLLTDKSVLQEYQRKAFEQITTKWNHDVAAKRLVEAAEHLLNKESFYFEDGPMSVALNISNKGAEKYITYTKR